MLKKQKFNKKGSVAISLLIGGVIVSLSMLMGSVNNNVIYIDENLTNLSGNITININQTISGFNETDDIYLYNVSNKLYFNETKLNQTIDDLAGNGTCFWNETAGNVYLKNSSWNVGIGTTVPGELLELGEGSLKMAGIFKNYPTADSAQGFVIDNTATGYTGAEPINVFQQKFEYRANAENHMGKFSGILNDLDNYCQLTGSPPRGLSSTTYGINNNIRLYGSHNQTPGHGGQSEEVIGITNTIDSIPGPKREITESINTEWVASDNYVYDKSIYDKVGGVFNVDLFGQKTYISNYMAEIPNGFMTSKMYGIYSTVTSKPNVNSDVTTYGIYINSMGGDTSYGVYSYAGINYFKDKVGIGTNTPATSAALEISSVTGALLLPRMTTAQKNALTAVNGMILYDTTTNKIQGYANGAWVDLH